MGNGGGANGNPYFSLSFRRSTLTSFQLAQLRRLTFCFSTLKMIPAADADPNLTAQEINFDIGDVDFEVSGTDLSNVSIPEGRYDTIELTLNTHCPTQRSLHITNDQGIFSSLVPIVLTFTGAPIDVNENLVSISLNVDAIIANLLQVSAESQIRNAAEATAGSF